MTSTQAVATMDWKTAISTSESKFKEFNTLDFSQEQIFATQLMKNNDYLLQTAKKDPTSLKLALYNVAAIGLSLHPSSGLAYLIPRKGKIIVDISYRGLIKLGVESGAIRWAKAELVYAQDSFTYHGPAEKPTHNYDPFESNRGELRGGYCIAELASGGFLVEAMSKADMDKIRNSSEAFKKKSGPWVEWEDQMQLKSIVKRAYKWWPSSNYRMAEAVRILNEDNEEGLSSIKESVSTVVSLPEPPRPEDVSTKVVSFVNQLVVRAIDTGAYEASKELARSRLTNLSDLSYALNEIGRAATDQGQYDNSVVAEIMPNS
ncbi:recombinase RecT [Alkalimarinus alittae]|uniref:Recombinase RecT n=1 Tax=Alkalimarinus alittae TaxID=2961619 RepID=A0ABY6N555_9ALTE|nr:recombinase RecT [Alkalimarinus alittae]UZE97257.1 recombinase RecT [Alkalimarinus alittae]